MSDDLIIRAPRPEDYESLVAIERASFSDPWEPENFWRLVTDQSEHCRVAERGGRVLGYWVGTRIDDEAELANFVVDASERRSGVGSRLLEDFLHHVGARERTTVFLEVRVSNTAARALYGRYGFVELTRRKAYYAHPTEDAILMARRP